MSGVNNDIRQLTVRSALIHGSRCQTNAVVPTYYVHWRIYFQLNFPHPTRTSSPCSIEFNSQKLQADGSTRLYINFRLYEHSDVVPTMGRYEIPMIRQVTVQQLIDLVLGRNQRDKYRLTEGGSGCRFWCQTVTSDLEQVGWIESGSGAQLESYFRSLHQRYGNGWIPYPLYQGTFY
jgi:hypothetical protein